MISINNIIEPFKKNNLTIRLNSYLRAVNIIDKKNFYGVLCA